MMGRIIEISTDNKHLSIDRGFLIISEDKKEIGKIALDTIEAVIVYAHGITYSNNVLVKLAEQKAPLVICDKNFLPTSILIPIEGNYSQASIMDAQTQATEPTKKRLWQQIVKTKLLQQASVLKFLDKPYKFLEELAKSVKSGDIDNKEGEGARKYFPLLFGKDFLLTAYWIIWYYTQVCGRSSDQGYIRIQHLTRTSVKRRKQNEHYSGIRERTAQKRYPSFPAG